MENAQLLAHIDALAHALSKVMETVSNLDNGENCPYCGKDYNFDLPTIYGCDSNDCEGNIASQLLSKPIIKLCAECIIDGQQSGTINEIEYITVPSQICVDCIATGG